LVTHFLYYREWLERWLGYTTTEASKVTRNGPITTTNFFALRYGESPEKHKNTSAHENETAHRQQRAILIQIFLILGRNLADWNLTVTHENRQDA
jgi:hypothetical protein